jgi:hypothetical protein
MANEKTPLEKLQGEAASTLLISTIDRQRVLDAFLVQAFDLGSRAQRELAEDAAQIRTENCTCPAKIAGYAHTTDLHTEACALHQPAQLPRENWSMEEAAEILGLPTED